jgi:uncharacterized protein YjbJ (UPF0337 family)
MKVTAKKVREDLYQLFDGEMLMDEGTLESLIESAKENYENAKEQMEWSAEALEALQKLKSKEN